MVEVNSEVVKHIKCDMLFLSKLTSRGHNGKNVLISDDMIFNVVNDMVANIGVESVNDLVFKLGITDDDFIPPMDTYMLKDLIKEVSKKPSKSGAVELFKFCNNYLYANIGFLLASKVLLESNLGYLSIDELYDVSSIK